MTTTAEQNWITGTDSRSPGKRASRRAASSVAPASGSNRQPSSPSREAVEKKAYEIWLSCGCEHGHDFDHWVEAERQLRQQTSGS